MKSTSPGSAQIRLASASPRRAELLDRMGIHYWVESVPVDESSTTAEAPQAMAARLARDKARAGARCTSAPLVTLGADTLVVIDGEALGKPADRDHGIAMLMRLSGRWHEVLTAVALVDPVAGRECCGISTSRVRFADISKDDCVRYWNTGECADKAGAYGIQGVGGIFVAELHGSWSGVVGLPVDMTERLLTTMGVDCWQHRCGPDMAAPDA